MSIRKNLLVVSGIIFLASAFIISFNWGMNKFGGDSGNKTHEINQVGTDKDKLASAVKIEQTVSPNAKITLKLEYMKSGDIVSTAPDASQFVGKTKGELENENYIVEDINSKEVLLTKKLDRYAPNKYVLGVFEQCLAIYKTDDEGNMYIEDENTDITDIVVPTEADYNRLVKGDKIYQCNSKEEAEEKLGEYYGS